MRKIILFVKEFKVIYIQAVVFTIIGLFKQHYGWVIFSSVISVLPLISQAGARRYVEAVEWVVNTTGLWIRYLLFLLFFIFVLCPVALFVRKKNQKTDYIPYERAQRENSFEKMW